MMSKSLVVAPFFLAAMTAAALAQAPAAAPPAAAAPPPPPMGFFVTSTVPGTGNLGGLAGADKICQDLAAAAGAGNRTWRAYLSAQPVAAQGGNPAQPAVNARDRIGNGPWANAKGVIIAANLADLHGDVERDRNYILKFTALDEKGKEIPGVGDTPNQHDVLTGSDSRGMAYIAGTDMTCGNWTSDAAGPASRAMLGHTDRRGLDRGGNTSWNTAHMSAGCDAASLVRTGGNGRFYCFAAQ
jgi:hypothetical protein